jgi:ubiquinone/menaquinone biosynthesis C-methylase UbiE
VVTDYGEIAPNYDKNPNRAKGVDEEIERILQKNQDEVRILDLACGTGNYLKAQSEYYTSANIEWIGIDKSREMLQYAKKKNKNMKFICDTVENFGNMETDIDYVRNEFAFHHFADKEAAVRNINRMLKLNGTYMMINICPDYTNNSWVYEYFPSTKEIDNNRFMKISRIYELFVDSGFLIDMKIETTVFELDYKSAIEETENRDMSQLNLIPEEEYQTGLERMEKDYRAKKRNICDSSMMECKGIKNFAI